MLINLSNHPKEKWEEKQISVAQKLYGAVEDLPFPHINPEATENEITELAKSFVEICAEKFSRNGKKEKNAVHIMGEFTFVCAFVETGRKNGIECVASTSERNVTEKENGEKVIRFNFVKFRKYALTTNGEVYGNTDINNAGN